MFGELAPWLSTLTARIEQVAESIFPEEVLLLRPPPFFDQTIINKYLPGMGIKPHVDLLKFEDGIVVLSLLSPYVMDFEDVSGDGGGGGGGGGIAAAAAGYAYDADQEAKRSRQEDDGQGEEAAGKTNISNASQNDTHDDDDEEKLANSGKAKGKSAGSIDKSFVQMGAAPHGENRIRQRRSLSFMLKPRGLLCLSGPARWDWTHGIAGRKTDEWQGSVSERGVRYSITLRKLVPGA